MMKMENLVSFLHPESTATTDNAPDIMLIDLLLGDARIDVLPLSDPSPEMWFPPDSADYETERYLAQRFGIIKFRQYFGLDPLLKHHGELRTLTGAMIRTRKNFDEIRTMVLRVRAERLAGADWDSARGKRMTSQGDVLRVCAWLRSEQEDGSERSAGEARGGEGSTSWKRKEGRSGGSEGTIDLTSE